MRRAGSRPLLAVLLSLQGCANLPSPGTTVGPVTTFTLEAQGKLERCATLAGLWDPDPRNTVPPAADAAKGRDIVQCVTDAKAAVEDKYRAALNAVRLQRGTFSALKAYYDEWEDILDQLPTGPAAHAGPPVRREIEQLQSRADGFNGR